MKNNLLCTFILLFFAFYSFSQDSIRISGQLLNNTRFAKIVVQKFGAGVFDIAAIAVDKETGKFSITAPIDVEPGIYRFRYSQTRYEDFVDVIINGKESEVVFIVDVSQESDKRNPIFTVSKENISWYQFKKFQSEKLNEILVMQTFLGHYPNKQHKIYLILHKEYEKSKNEYVKDQKQYVEETPFYWAKSMAQYQNIYFTNLSEHERLQAFSVFENFWEGKPTTDDLLLNTPLYTDAILNYLQYYINPAMQFSEQEQNDGFKKCVDKIIQQFGRNDVTKLFAIKYLQMGFKEIGNETILQYIDQAYAINEQCTTDNDDELLRRLKGYEALKIGSLAPEIQITASDGSIRTLKDFPQEQVVLVFWASWCPYCMKEMSKLQEWAQSQRDILVLAINLDDDYTAFQNAIKDFPDMLHYCDLQKWNGEIVTKYYVAATPTLYLIDRERKIINKWSSISSFVALAKSN